MTQNTLLIEILAEEMPPKSLARLGRAFYEGVYARLQEHRLLADTTEKPRWFATPRRLAMQIPSVQEKASDCLITEKIMPVNIAFDSAGNPTQPLLKKLEAKGIPTSEITKFERRIDGKAEMVFYQNTQTGVLLEKILADVINETLKKLPIAKFMRWGMGEAQFVRPIHGLVLLHGDRLIKGEILGIHSGRSTNGHRFLASGAIQITHAEDYVKILHDQGKVIACFEQRKALIMKQLDSKASELSAVISPADGLLDEVTGLVEWPQVYAGTFDEAFLDIPQECLILSMQQHQKYFPLFDTKGNLLNKFLIVSNMKIDDASHIITGNEKVIRPRLSDAQFFYDQDRKIGLDVMSSKLANVVYHNKLGSQAERVTRQAILAAKIASLLGASKQDIEFASRAAQLAKADLVSDMVGEFPELQGVMGSYYAAYAKEPEAVTQAIGEHYLPRFSGDNIPSSQLACIVALADKLDTLVAFFGIGQAPTGDKDPFGLRRAALGVLRILIEAPLEIDLHTLLEVTQAGFKPGILTAETDTSPLLDFLFDRMRVLLRDSGIQTPNGQVRSAPDLIESVLAQGYSALNLRVDLIPARLVALQKFLSLPESSALIAANKRIGNILKKVEGPLPMIQESLLCDLAEKTLAHEIQQLLPQVKESVKSQNYNNALCLLAGIRPHVDCFFDEVMVMADDLDTRTNRLALLAQLHEGLNAVADISRLQST